MSDFDEDEPDLPPLTPEQEEAQLNLQAAIEAWAEAMGLTTGGHVNDWYLIGTTIWLDRPGRTRYWEGSRGGSQPPHITAGLLKYGTTANERDIWSPGVGE